MVGFGMEVCNVERVKNVKKASGDLLFTTCQRAFYQFCNPMFWVKTNFFLSVDTDLLVLY